VEELAQRSPGIIAFAEDLEGFAGRSSDSMLLHVLDGNAASLPKQRDWLDGEPVDDFLNRVMRANLDALADEFGSDDLDDWAGDMPHAALHAAQRPFLRLRGRQRGRRHPRGRACHDALPGNVRTLDYMNRGTYNHQVEFRAGAAPAGPLPGIVPDLGAWGAGLARRGPRRPPCRSPARSSRPASPGSSARGQQDPHYADQHELYAGWEYKPMPLREEDVLRPTAGTGPRR
jgi:acyl-homoserine lactone acylase PvdQ